MVALVGPGTPYITPDVLRRAPTGIDWDSIPTRRASTPEQASELANLCVRATGEVDVAANQVLRATIDDEYFTGPDWRVTIQRPAGVVRILTSRWPILYPIGARVSPAGVFPRNWTAIPATLIDVEKPAIGVYGSSQAVDSADGGQALLMAPGTLGWALGRNGWRINTQSVSGWPHTALTGSFNEGVSTLAVEDCSGWGPPPAGVNGPAGLFGATGIIYDGIRQEVFKCTSASAVAGPGTITLASPVVWPHGFGVLVTTMPQVIINAAIDFASSMALERGATATAVQSISGGSTDSGGPVSAGTLREWATKAVQKFARVV